MVQIDVYMTFKDLGHKSKVRPPPGYKRINIHLVFDAKHDGQYKARLVADGQSFYRWITNRRPSSCQQDSDGMIFQERSCYLGSEMVAMRLPIVHEIEL